MERGDTVSSAKGKNLGLFESVFSDKKRIETKLKVSFSFLKETCSDALTHGLYFWPPVSIWCLEL